MIAMELDRYLFGIFLELQYHIVLVVYSAIFFAYPTPQDDIGS